MANIEVFLWSAEKMLEILFRGKILRKKYSADFYCYDKIIVELKATNKLNDNDLSQVLNYLKATNQKIGLLINFGAERLEYKRVIRATNENQNHKSAEI